MITADIWERLGIAATTDEAELRRAYAERLKRMRPDDDSAGFRALREAFDAARKLAHGRPPPPRQHEPAAVHEPAPLPTVYAVIRDSLARGAYLDAAREWSRAAAVGDLGFDEEPKLQAEIARAMADAPQADLFALEEAAQVMQWRDAARALGAPAAILDAMARRDALAWLVELRACAQAGWRLRLTARARNHAARLLLRPAPGPLARCFPYVLRAANFTYWSRDLNLHRRWLGRAVDPARLEWCAASRRRLDARLLSKACRAVMAWITIVILISAIVTATVVAVELFNAL